MNHLVKLMVPTLALLACVPAAAHVWCVSTAVDLRAKLLLAQANGEDDTIKLVRGTYLDGGNEFNFTSTEGYALVVNGGFDAGCTQTQEDPRLTILDGGGLTQVFSTDSHGSVAIRYLTIQNGRRDGSAGGGFQMYGTGAASAVILAVNIFRNNTSNFATSVGAILVEGAVHLNGNLIVDNHTPAANGLSINGGANALVYLTNNTITGNTTGNATGGFLYFTSANAASPSIYVSNNIMWGNTADSDFQFFGGGAELIDNDVGVVDGFQTSGSTGNVSVTPGFVGATDYHLAATSPLLQAGTVAPTGGLPNVDLEGHPRMFGGFVDLGVYERGDALFDDGFEL
ncbi:MAG: hypothetical protein ABIQ70_02730 [Dokdonella sp.]